MDSENEHSLVEEAAKSRLTALRRGMETDRKASMRSSFREKPDFANDPLSVVLQHHYDSASAAHVLYCAVSLVGDADLMLEIARGLKDSSSAPRQELIEEMENSLPFEKDLNEMLADLYITDLLSYQEQYDSSVSDGDKANLGEYYRKRTRGTFSIVGSELRRLAPGLEDIDDEVKQRISKLKSEPTFFDEYDVVNLFQEIYEAGGVKQVFDDTIEANNSGDVDGLDRGMKLLIRHYAIGAAIIDNTLASKWIKGLETERGRS